MGDPGLRVPCFKAYDLRGRVPDQLNEDIAYRVGRAYARVVVPRRVVVGWDIRLSSPGLAEAVTRGLNDAGVDVISIGLCGTEQVYFATFHLGVDGGIMVTASHNPSDYNGMKLVREHSRPISGDSGLRDIEASVAAGTFDKTTKRGSVDRVDILPAYVEHLLGYVDPASLPACKVVANAGNGGAGLVIDALEGRLPIEFVKVHHEPDGTFPHGVPNPLLPENRDATSQAVRASGASLGLAWDGDFDRCFLFDETGAFVEGYYIVGLLAACMLRRAPGAKVIHDPRLTWNTIEAVRAAGGIAVQSKTGHAFIKERMRAEDAVYGGEMSAHHYFRDFAYCDSGMIPWLLVVQELGRSGQALSALLSERQAAFPVSGELNRRIADAERAIARVRAKYEPQALSIDETDGVSLAFETWRFNLRTSNTEPVVRLNVESRGDRALMQEKTAELLCMLDEEA